MSGCSTPVNILQELFSSVLTLVAADKEANDLKVEQKFTPKK